jgi:hypothetical protein
VSRRLTTEIPPRKPPRSLGQYLPLMAIVLCAGHLVRKYSHHLLVMIQKRTGDALWACAVFVLVAILRPRWSTFVITAVSLAISYSVEFSQIYHAPWIDSIRSTWLGRMILGTTFFWRDQLAYTIGIGALVPVDWWLSGGGRRKSRKK